MSEETAEVKKFRPFEGKPLIEPGSVIHMEVKGDEIVTQRHLHVALGDYFNEHGKYPERVTLPPAQFLHLRAALGLYGNVEHYEYMQFIFEPRREDKKVEDTVVLTNEDLEPADEEPVEK